MKYFDTLSAEITIAILMLLERRDLLRVLRTCRKLNNIGSPLLDSRLWYPVGSYCTRYAGVTAEFLAVERERLRVLQVLSDHRRVHHLSQLTITDRSCTHCTEDHANGKLVRDIRRKALSTLANMIPRAINLRHIRLDVPDNGGLPEELLRYNQLDTLLVRLPQRLNHPALSNLRHLTLHVDQQQHPFETLPSLLKLDSLQIHVGGRPARQHLDLVNLSRYPILKSMCVDGDAWTGFTGMFTGQSQSLEACVLRGQLVVTNQLNDFFSRIAASLKYLYCHGVHFVGSIEVALPQLELLSLHKVLSSNRLSPFARCPVLRTIAIEADNVMTRERQDDLNSLLQLVVLRSASTLGTLILRSGLSWRLSPIAIHALQRSRLLRYLLLDGSIIVDGRDWLLMSRTGSLDVVAKIDSWMLSNNNNNKLLEHQRVPGMAADSGRKFHMRPSLLPARIRACSCGFLNRMCFFKQSATPEVCFRMYNWLIAEPRRSTCQHGIGGDITEHELTPCVLGWEEPRLIPLPGTDERFCSLVG